MTSGSRFNDPPVPKQPERDPSLAEVDRLFQVFLERWYRGDDVEFESYCREHADHAHELRRCHQEWRRVADMLERASPQSSLASRLTSEYGEGVEPDLTLEPDLAVPAETRDDSASHLLKRLAARGLRRSRYQMRGKMAQGGMGIVFRVWDEDLRRPLAMKVILGRDQSSANPVSPDRSPRVAKRELMRFLEEAQVTGQLDHPGIVPVHELGIDPDGRVYFTMRLVRGRTLREIFDLVRDDKESWSETRALSVMLRACEARSAPSCSG